MRLPSNGISPISSPLLIMSAQALSAVALSGHSTHENATDSSSLAWTARRKSVCLPGFTSSPQFSTTRVAPRFLNDDQLRRTNAVYSSFLFVATGATKPE